MAGRGGKMPGAGRPKGAVTVKTRQIAERAIQEGITPLEVMLNNMRFHYMEANDFMAQLIDRAQQSKPIEANELKGLLVHLDGCRVKAQECARDAAPYIHPKLSTTTLKGDEDKPIEINITRKIVAHRPPD